MTQTSKPQERNREGQTVNAYLLERVQEHERYIRTGGPISRKVEGDREHAEWELIESATDDGFEHFDDFVDSYNEKVAAPWFRNLVIRQARCNYYEH